MQQFSRRAFMTATAATITGTGIAAAPLALHASQNSDASLLAMGREWESLFFEELPMRIKASDEARKRFASMEPEFPAALSKTQKDRQLGLCAPAVFDQSPDYDGSDVERLRSKLWPEAQARADEIIAAWERYLADDAAAWEASGYSAADDAHGETVSRIADLERRIARGSATTPDGLLVKARIAAATVDAAAGIEAEIASMIANRTTPSDFIALSLARDLIALGSKTEG